MRERLEAQIEALIGLLDALDAPEEEREELGDAEPSLGASEPLPHGRASVVHGRRVVTYHDDLDQTHWGEGPGDPALLDREQNAGDEGEPDGEEGAS